jgi:hypothetical protein
MTTRILTQEELKEQLHYNPETGIFTRLVSNSNRVKTGSIAGGVDKSTGYIRISVNGKLHYAHRLAFLFMDGKFPLEQVDHANGVCDDNRWLNIRHASCSENLRNVGLRADNTSGYRGVSFYKARGKYEAYCNTGGKRTKLGYHDTAESAYEAYKAFAKLSHGKFYRG